tara:strand:+ start:515 stop:694 length:180 start_codon:yes stop_codon:yes gene_type:complete
MSRLEALKGLKIAYAHSLAEMKKALNDLQLRYDVIQEHLESVEEKIAHEEEIAHEEVTA